jgi:hypothetical protein
MNGIVCVCASIALTAAARLFSDSGVCVCVSIRFASRQCCPFYFSSPRQAAIRTGDYSLAICVCVLFESIKPENNQPVQPHTLALLFKKFLIFRAEPGGVNYFSAWVNDWLTLKRRELLGQKVGLYFTVHWLTCSLAGIQLGELGLLNQLRISCTPTILNLEVSRVKQHTEYVVRDIST